MTSKFGKVLFHKSETDIVVSGHRGMLARYPENTMLSFRKAIEAGVDQLEIDINMTRDCELVIIHDCTVDRTTEKSGRVRSFTLDEIKRKDRMILIPYTMTRYFNSNQPIDQFVVKVKSSDAIAPTVTSLNGFLSGLIGDQNGSYGVTSPQTYQKEQNQADAMQQRFLGGIAAISLLVGGIGIMNIMLVTVTERTREIGIRKAIGAERRSIIVQFLIEAAMICGIGGLFGIVVGYIGTLIVGKLSFNMILIPSPGVTLGAAAISVALGIIFGMYPAIKASGLQPVVALRAD